MSSWRNAQAQCAHLSMGQKAGACVYAFDKMRIPLDGNKTSKQLKKKCVGESYVEIRE